MKVQVIAVLVLFLINSSMAQPTNISGPDGKLTVQLEVKNGVATYTVGYDGTAILEDSPLGLLTNISDFSKNLKLDGVKENEISKSYRQDRIKHSEINYHANERIFSFSNDKNQHIELIFRVSNNDLALKYRILPSKGTASCIVEKECTGFNFPSGTTTFLTPQSPPMKGWMRTKPSYEEEYVADEPIATPSKFSLGYTFPGLFNIGGKAWALVSETGVHSTYCASRLSESDSAGLYTIAFPDQGENNGHESATPAMALPGDTPWRTLTLGTNLKPIVETTIYSDVVEPLYEASQAYRFGRSTWSWIMWQDHSMNYDDQVAYIDLASQMGYEYILMDALWDTNIGYERMETLIKYAQSKKVDVFLWYNSNGSWNDAPQGPKHKLNTSVARKKEMKWMQRVGVKGIKVDFFGGDKQATMQLYEDILSDANEYGIMISFHGCTLPRGWERMFPNYIGSEAVLASENLIFTQRANDMEAFNACLHPFIRNAVGSMEFGPVLLNRRHNRSNNGGNTRRTTDVFQLATSVLYQNAVQFFAIAPNNLTEFPDYVIDFMKTVPTTWDETVFVEGYPGKYVVLARRHGNSWYVVGANAHDQPMELNLNLPMLAGKTVSYYGDDNNAVTFLKQMPIDKNGKVKVTLQTKGGLVLKN